MVDTVMAITLAREVLTQSQKLKPAEFMDTMAMADMATEAMGMVDMAAMVMAFTREVQTLSQKLKPAEFMDIMAMADTATEAMGMVMAMAMGTGMAITDKEYQ